MSGNSDLMYLPLEWESMTWPREITHLQGKNNFYQIPSDGVLTVERGNDFKLSASLSGFSDRVDVLEYRPNGLASQPGEIMLGEEIEGVNRDVTQKYLVKYFYPSSISKGMRDAPKGKFSFTAKVIINYLEESFIDDQSETESVTEFFLSSKIHTRFSRRSRRTKVENVTKRRDDIDPIGNDLKVTNRSGWSDDFVLINTPVFDFVVQYVDGSFLPEWANGIQIEYRKTFKSIPDDETRKAISEITGFVLGTHLNKIGETHFNQSQKVIKRIAVNPWGDNVVDKSKANAQPPFSFNDHRDVGKMERVLNGLVGKYLEVRTTYGLSDILWKYWIAQELAVGTNLPIYSSALESLAENFLKANGISVKYSKEEKDIHQQLVDEHLSKYFDQLSKTAYGQRLINSIKNPFSLGIGDKLKLFFQALSFDIPNKSIENDALKARNKMTHGAINSADMQERNKYIKLTEAYFTFINRCLLAVLSCDEKYVDYFSVGLPERNVKENITVPPEWK